MLRSKTICSIFLLASLIVIKSFAQTEHFTFTQFKEKDGLCDNFIYSIAKDNKGILWIGTQNGLSRFDGNHFYNFRRTSSANSIINNTIYTLCIDSNRNIWGGTNNGIFMFNPSINRFTNYALPKFTYRKLVYNILCDKAGNIYATQNNSILKLNKQTNQFELFFQVEGPQNTIDNYSILRNCLVYDTKNHSFWIGLKVGLQRLDIASKKLHFFTTTQQTLFAKRDVSGLNISSSGEFWFCDNSNKQLVSFDPTLLVEKKKISLQQQEKILYVTKLLVDKSERIWISTNSYKIYLVDQTKNNQISTIKSIESNNNTIGSDFFWTCLEDENGSIWFGTLNGISICNTAFQVYKSQYIRKSITELDTIKILFTVENKLDKSWLIVTNSTYLINYFPVNKKYNKIFLNSFEKNNVGNKPEFILQILFKDSAIYYVTNAGVWQQKKGSTTIKFWHEKPNNILDFTINKVVFGDSCDYFSDGRRLLIWHKNNHSLEWISEFREAGNGSNIFGFKFLCWHPNYPLFWVSQYKYVATLASPNQWKLFNIIKNDSLDNGAYIADAKMDNNGMIWLINKGVGLCRFNTKTKEVKYWTELDGLSDNHLHAINIDLNGNIWGLYWNKLSVFNPKANSFINLKIPFSETNYDYLNYLTLRQDGIMMAGLGNEIFELYIENFNKVPQNIIPSFSVVSFSGQNFFDTDNQELKIGHNDNTLTINFGLLVDPKAFQHTFEYILDGSDKKWNATDYATEVRYNNLTPGDYIFRLRAVKKNSNWKSEEKILRFTILTPFYQSTWFITCALLAVGLAIYLYYKNRLNQKEKFLLLETRAELLEKEKAKIMYENLKQQLNPHFLFNSLTSLSGLIQIDQNEAGAFLHQMSGIYRYILQNADNELVLLKSELDFANLYINIQLTRFSKGLQINIHIPSEYYNHLIAPVTLQNLIENAIKHNIIDEEEPLIISIFVENNYLIVSNNLQRKSKVENSNKKGLLQLQSLYKYLSNNQIIISEEEKKFTIKIPLIESK